MYKIVDFITKYFLADFLVTVKDINKKVSAINQSARGERENPKNAPLQLKSIVETS